MVPDGKFILNLPLLKWIMLSWAVRELFRPTLKTQDLME
jgi:hypothetical protein